MKTSPSLKERLRTLCVELVEPYVFEHRRKKRLANFKLHRREDAPTATLDCRITAQCTSALCTRASVNYDEFFGSMTRLIDRYPKNPKRQVTLMALNLNEYGDFKTYLSALRKQSFFHRKAKRSKSLGYIVEQFQYQNYTPDIRAIRNSVKERDEGLPLDRFVLTQHALKLDPQHHQELKAPQCARHWELWFGVFKPLKAYTQGSLSTEQRLLGYARLRRIGNTIKYAEFIGHGDKLADGIMMHLHLHMVQWIMASNNPHTQGVDYLTYNTLEKGTEGLLFWKRKGLFTPHIIHMKERATLPIDFDAKVYLALNPDVARAGRDPAIHYLMHGQEEQRMYRYSDPSDLAT